MKKFLALVLALVMTMSLVTISAGAEDFTDDSKITYEEAVDVMTAAGVVGGYADGSFNPTAGLTRGAAAKIICNMLLGPTTAEALVANEAPFVDVAVDNVFAGYIAYCVNEGIISGYADGTFKPAAPLTGYAFMKMLLGALGYDAAVEGYVGTNWSIQVAKRALNIGLDDGLVTDFAGAKALTREEACLYAFNTLTATMVEYDNNSSVSIGDVVITNSSKAKAVENHKSTYLTAGNTMPDGYTGGNNCTGTMQFCEQYFSNLKFDAYNVTDDFGRSAHTWTNKTTTVGKYADKADIVITEALTLAEVAALIKGIEFNNVKVVDKTTPVGASSYNVGDLTVDANEAIAQAVKDETKNGQLVEIFVDENNDVTNVAITTYSLAKVTKVEEKNGDVSITLDNNVGKKTNFADPDKADQIVVNGTVVKGDYVTYTVQNNKVYAYVTETFQGAQSAYNTAKETITVAGATYEVGTGLTNVAMGDFANSNKADNTYYVDQFGFVVKTTAAAASSDYAYIVDSYGKVSSTLDATNTPYIEVRAVLADGTVAVYEIAMEEIKAGDARIAGTVAEGDWVLYDTSIEVTNTTSGDCDTWAYNNLEGKVFGYTVSGKVMTLETIATTMAAETTSTITYAQDTIAKKETSVVATQGTALLSNDTVIVVYDDDAKAAKVYNGTADLGTTELTGFVGVVSGKSASLSAAKVIFATVSYGVVADTSNYAYIDTTKVTTTGVGADAEFVYTGILADGSEITLTAESALTGYNATMGALYKYSAEGTVKQADRYAFTSYNAFTGNEKITYARFTVTDNMVNFTNNSNFYDMSEAQVVYVGTDLDEVNDNAGWAVLKVVDGAVTKVVETIYVMEN